MKPTAIIQTIEQLVEGIDGWTPIDQLYTLYTIAIMTQHIDGDLMEVGAWCGRSSAVLALACQHSQGQLTAIDLFPAADDWQQNPDGSFSFTVTIENNQYKGYHSQTVWEEPFVKQIKPVYDKNPSLIEQFKSNLTSRNLLQNVTIHQGTLQSYSISTPKQTFRLIFLDGDHGYEAIKKDISIATELLATGGWLCFDDAFSSYDGVDQAIQELIIDNPAFNNGFQMTRKFFIAQKK